MTKFQYKLHGKTDQLLTKKKFQCQKITGSKEKSTVSELPILIQDC